MSCHVGRAVDEIFFLYVIQQPIVGRMCGVVCASESGKLVAGQGTPALVIERVERRAIDIPLGYGSAV